MINPVPENIDEMNACGGRIREMDGTNRMREHRGREGVKQRVKVKQWDEGRQGVVAVTIAQRRS